MRITYWGKSRRSGQKSVSLVKQWAFSGVGELTYIWIFSAFRAVFAQNSNRSAPLAQLVEQRTFNPQVLGSSPRGRTFIWAGCDAHMRLPRSTKVLPQ